MQGVQVDNMSMLDTLKSKYDGITDNTVTVMQQQYINYAMFGGNPWVVPVSVINSVEATDLKKAYKSKAQPFSYIKEIRDSSPDICPMCGSLSTGTVDHYLPKEHYPEFSVFSKNLIPACKCNSIKSDKYKGEASPKRFIHPLLDSFAEERLYQIKLSGDLEVPAIDIVLHNTNHPEREVLEFHKENLLDKNHFCVWVFRKWGRLIKMPGAELGMLFETTDPIDIGRFSKGIRRYEDSTTKSLGTSNNWLSMLLYGILNDQNQLQWLNDRYNNSLE